MVGRLVAKYHRELAIEERATMDRSPWRRDPEGVSARRAANEAIRRCVLQCHKTHGRQRYCVSATHTYASLSPMIRQQNAMNVLTIRPATRPSKQRRS